MTPLTARQLIALRYIVACVRDRQCPPTMREIGRHMAIRSTNGVDEHLCALERKGCIKRSELTARGIYVTELGRDAAFTCKERP